MPFEQELDIYLRSRFTLITLVTPEEERALATVRRSVRSLKSVRA